MKHTDYQHFAAQIIELLKVDEDYRNQLIEKGRLGEGYDDEMARIHHHNADRLHAIIEEIGYPTARKVGPEASEAARRIIQHAIGRPAFMRRAAALLEEAVRNHQADPRTLTYWSDRIAVLEGGRQRYGTQFDWDEHGAMNPTPYDDLALVNQRRKAMGLNTLEEQTAWMRQRMIMENQKPPRDFEARKRA